MAKAEAATSSAPAKWAKRVERLERSGQSLRTFAAREGLKAGSLSFWKWKLGQGGRRQGGATPVSPLKFVELTTSASPPAASAAPAPFEIVLLSGRAVRVPAGFDGAELLRLVTVLEEARP